MYVIIRRKASTVRQDNIIYLFYLFNAEAFAIIDKQQYSKVITQIQITQVQVTQVIKINN